MRLNFKEEKKLLSRIHSAYFYLVWHYDDLNVYSCILLPLCLFYDNRAKLLAYLNSVYFSNCPNSKRLLK